MNIAYFTWNEVTGPDITDTLQAMGHSVAVFRHPVTDYNLDPSLCEYLDTMKAYESDCIFSCDYLPVLSDYAQNHNIIYISWVYDCPHYTLLSRTIYNSVNRIHVFDRNQYNELVSYGCTNVYHQPLAVNPHRINSITGYDGCNGSISYTDDVTFIGSLYTQSQYDQIKYLPDNIKGFLDGIIASQSQLSGITLSSRIITDELLNEISSYVQFDLGSSYLAHYRQIICGMIDSKASSLMRIRVLNELAAAYRLSLYTASDYNLIPDSEYKGCVSYSTQMPLVFNRSRININMSLSSIVSGIPLRALDIMAAGGFLISTMSEELNESFINGKDCIICSCPDELVYYTGYYLNNDKERAAIAHNGWLKTADAFSYEKALTAILASI